MFCLIILHTAKFAYWSRNDIFPVFLILFNPLFASPSLSPWDRARQWLSPQEMSMTLVMLSSSIKRGLSEVVSDEPQPRHEPQPHANTCITHTGEHRDTRIYKGGYNGTCLLSSSLWDKWEVVYTWPADVKASDDWLPAHTFLIIKPCRASITLGLYTRFVSPCPSLPVTQTHK